MEKSPLNNENPYARSSIVLTTKHGKVSAIAPPFRKKLAAEVTECNLDTDMFGTFSGEVERKNNALESACHKCEWGMKQILADYGLASEGSFGPHPFIPFLPCDHEILYFIDRKRDFHLHISHLSQRTNYQMQVIDSLEALQKLAQQTQFPSHALIIRPNAWEDKSIIFKGIQSQNLLEEAFKESLKHSADNKVWVETDMRAHLNPSRMVVITELAEKLAERLANTCPKCNMPGWGKVRVQKGLECNCCKSETELVKTEIFGCTKCDYEETKQRADSLTSATPENCSYCNP